MNKNRVYTIVGAFAGAATLVRLMQLLTAVEPETGFYEKGHASVPILYGILILAAAYCLLLYFTLPRSRAVSARLPGGMGAPARRLISLAVAFIFAVSVFRSAEHAFTGLGLEFSALLLLFGEAACAAFFLCAALIRPGRGGYAAVRYLALLPVLWSVVRLVVSFMGYTTVANISAQLFNVLQMTALMFYLLNEAKFVAGVAQPRAMTSFGFLSVILISVTVLPGVILFFVPDYRDLSGLSYESLIDAGLAVYILATVGAAFPSRRAAADHTEPAERTRSASPEVFPEGDDLAPDEPADETESGDIEGDEADDGQEETGESPWQGDRD